MRTFHIDSRGLVMEANGMDGPYVATCDHVAAIERLARFRDWILGGMHDGEYVGQSPVDLWEMSATQATHCRLQALCGAPLWDDGDESQRCKRTAGHAGPHDLAD